MAEGISLLADSVATLESDAVELVSRRRDQSAATLRCFSDEEAAKVLIILDMVRAGWQNNDAVGLCMSNFYSHLARGLYVLAYGGEPADLAEVRRFLNQLRQQFFLDGPTGVDWIYGNEIVTNREERLYVDYIEHEAQVRQWIGPAHRVRTLDSPYSEPSPTSVPVQLVSAMSQIGLLGEAGLHAISRAWTDVTVQDSMPWTDVERLNCAVVERLMDEDELDVKTNEDLHALKYVVDKWTFPLFTIDLKLAKVELDELKRYREEILTQELGLSEPSDAPRQGAAAAARAPR